MDFPHRGGQQDRHPHHHCCSGQDTMDFPHRGGQQDRHHHHHCCSGGHAYEGQAYPPVAAPADFAPPYGYAPAAPVSGPYTSHAPYYPHPHQDARFSHDIVSGVPPPFTQHELSSPAPQGQLVRLFCKGNMAFNLAVEHDAVIMKAANAQDEAQQWIKDDSYGMRTKDNYGHSAFALVNRKTGKVLQHAKQKGQQVLLMNCRPDIRDDDVLWTESQDFGEGFKTVRCASDTLLNLTVFEGVKTVRNGSALVLDTWHKGDHQLWRIFPLS